MAMGTDRGMGAAACGLLRVCDKVGKMDLGRVKIGEGLQLAHLLPWQE